MEDDFETELSYVKYNSTVNYRADVLENAATDVGLGRAIGIPGSASKEDCRATGITGKDGEETEKLRVIYDLTFAGRAMVRKGKGSKDPGEAKKTRYLPVNADMV